MGLYGQLDQRQINVSQVRNAKLNAIQGGRIITFVSGPLGFFGGLVSLGHHRLASADWTEWQTAPPGGDGNPVVSVTSE